MAKGASKSRGSGGWKTRRALVNISELEVALCWAEPRVLEIQAKLHRWAVADPGRRFDDLFNFVADPAFLLVAWARVRANKGARTAGVDGHTALSITAAMGVEGFLDRLRTSLKDHSFRPLPVRERMIPKAGGKKRRLGIATDDSYCPPAATCRDVSGSVRSCAGQARVRGAGEVSMAGGTDIPRLPQRRWRGLVRRAAGLRCPDCSIRRWQSAWSCWFQGMQNRPAEPRRAVSCPVWIQW
jgi:hypothetical protein